MEQLDYQASLVAYSTFSQKWHTYLDHIYYCFSLWFNKKLHFYPHIWKMAHLSKGGTFNPKLHIWPKIEMSYASEQQDKSTLTHFKSQFS